MKKIIKELESKVKNFHNTNTIFDTRNYVLLEDVKKILEAINYTHCCKSDSEQLVCENCKYTAIYIGYEISYLECLKCGKTKAY
jgi:predicted transcriptional regulator